MNVKRCGHQLSKRGDLASRVHLGHITSGKQQRIPLCAGTLIGFEQRPNVAHQYDRYVGELRTPREPPEGKVHEKIVTPLRTDRLPVLPPSDSPNDLKRSSHA